MHYFLQIARPLFFSVPSNGGSVCVVAPNVTDAEFRAGQLLARARWRRCLAFSLALRLFARIVLLDLAVLFT